jgi:hypothetical protein
MKAKRKQATNNLDIKGLVFVKQHLEEQWFLGDLTLVWESRPNDVHQQEDHQEAARA